MPCAAVLAAMQGKALVSAIGHAGWSVETHRSISPMVPPPLFPVSRVSKAPAWCLLQLLPSPGSHGSLLPSGLAAPLALQPSMQIR